MQYNQNHTDIFVEIIDSNVHMEIQRYRIDPRLPKYLINFKNKFRRLMKMHYQTVLMSKKEAISSGNTSKYQKSMDTEREREQWRFPPVVP